jgi:hypothetical protein
MVEADTPSQDRLRTALTFLGNNHSESDDEDMVTTNKKQSRLA